MSANTNIEWADHTFNPWIGCTQISPGCDNCYARAWDRRFAVSGHAMRWGPGVRRERTADSTWAMPMRWNRKAAAAGIRHRVFCASLADVFDNEVDPQWRDDLFSLISKTPHLDWLLLTKRIGNVASMVGTGIWPANAWLGITVVNQQEADRDVMRALRVKAMLRIGVLFLSCEPVLEPLQLWRLKQPDYDETPEGAEVYPLIGIYAVPDCDWPGPKVDWVIVGGESGPNARPMHPDWARSLRDQCQYAGVPFLFKQWGEWTPGENVERQRGTVDTAFWWGNKWITHPLNLSTDQGHIDDEPDLYRVGNKAAGRHLDGRTWDEFPK